MRVVYTAEFAVDVDAASKTMAIHEAGKLWPEIEEAVEAHGSNIVIKTIRVERDRQSEGEDDE
jgi:hypothetical protein